MEDAHSRWGKLGRISTPSSPGCSQGGTRTVLGGAVDDRARERGGQLMTRAMGLARLAELDRAVDRLDHLAANRPICEEERVHLESARDCLATYAMAGYDLTVAGVAPERLMALIERGWNEALATFHRAEEERAAHELSATG